MCSSELVWAWASMPNYIARVPTTGGTSGQASFPGNNWPNVGAKYVRLTRTDNPRISAIYKVALREGADGNQVWVAAGQLGLSQNQSTYVTFDVVNANAYQRNYLLRTPQGRGLLTGLALGVAGLWVDFAFEYGKSVHAYFHLNAVWATVIRVFALLAKVSGLIIVFLNATWWKKD